MKVPLFHFFKRKENKKSQGFFEVIGSAITVRGRGNKRERGDASHHLPVRKRPSSIVWEGRARKKTISA